ASARAESAATTKPFPTWSGPYGLARSRASLRPRKAAAMPSPGAPRSRRPSASLLGGSADGQRCLQLPLPSDEHLAADPSPGPRAERSRRAAYHRPAVPDLAALKSAARAAIVMPAVFALA